MIGQLRARPSRGIRWTAAAVAAWCVGFAVVNVVLEGSGRFDSGPYAQYAQALSLMGWLVVGLKLAGALIAVLAVTERPRRLPPGVRTTLVWGAFALLALYSAGNLVELAGFLVGDPGRVTPRSLAYVGFFLAGAAGYGVLALSYARRVRSRPLHVALGIVGAPLLLAAVLVGAPAALGVSGLL